MKKNLLFLFALICSVSLFTACANDDDDVKYPIDAEMAGVYKGTLDVSMDGAPLATEMPKNISITNAGNNSITVELKDFSFGGLELGTITISNCVVTQTGSTYSFTGAQTLTSLPEAIGHCPMVVAGTVIDGKTTINLDITVPLLDQTVKVIYKGARLSGSESAEAKISSFTFDSEVVTEQPVIDETAGTITFKVNTEATGDALKLTPVVTVSEKATVSPASGVVQNFADDVEYTVVAENGTVKVYTVKIAGKQSVMKFSFEEWIVDNSLYTDNIPLAVGGWANCNNAVALIKNMGGFAGIIYKGEYPVKASTESHSGTSAAEMISVDTQGGDMFGTKVPKVTAGSMFLGSFNAFAALADPMATTSFGVMYNKKPLEVKGFFKYKAGTEFYNKDGVLEPNTKDECSITAVFYEVSKEEDTLNGNDIYTSDKIVAKAIFNYGQETPEYTPFSLKMEYTRAYDATKLYKLAVIFSASKDGAAYNAAVGSRLLIDDVIIITE